MFDCFEFFKDIGRICGDIHFEIVYSKNWPFLAVAIDDVFHIYSAEELKLTQISTPHSQKITHIAANSNVVFTTTNSTLRATDIKDNEYDEIQLQQPPTNLISLDPYVVISQGTTFTCYSDELKEIFKIDVGKEITTVMHPYTYVNKLIVATSDGQYSLWNIKSQMCIYNFSGFGSIVKRIQQSPNPDVMAFALYDGRLVFHNVRQDETLFTFQMPAPITDFSFRIDGPPHIAVGMENGKLLVWDLNLKQIIASKSHCHNNSITSVSFMKTNLLITGSSDNSIKQWIADDETEDLLRIYRSRVGHETPPVAVSFVEVNGSTNIVTASGTSTIISANPIIETTSSIISTAPLNRKHLSNPIQSISTTNAQRYASIASQHVDGTLVFLWDIENSRFARKALTAMPKNGSRIESNQTITFADFNGEIKATCTYLTPCGNFGIVGTDAGTVEVFVTQSARHKGSIETKHDSRVVFVYSDSLNQHIISGAEDGTIYFHNFDELTFEGSINLESPITKMAPHPNSHLLAITANEKVYIVDVISKLIARIFEINGTSLCFSNDGKYLIISSFENVYLFDMMTASLIQSVKIPYPITGIAAHPKENLIATIHENNLSTKLWYFRPEKIISSESLNEIEIAKQEGLIIYSEQPTIKMKNVINPPTDPLKFSKTKIIVPFFLSASTNLALPNLETEENMTLDKDVMPSSEFVKQLIIDNEKDDFNDSINLMINMNHDAINLEISGLHVNGDCDERVLFMKMLIFGLNQRNNFEMIQALLSVFLNEFGAMILKNPNLKQLLNEVKEAQEDAIRYLEDNINYSLYLIQMINRIQ
ncbi:WD repeat-containing protein 36 [Histomonas meleagridis]|uniref:WD repeat-containing protein 36 n=1 Tax=Histomonas meleagridis TaxID=135588 RepID=UPI003559476B|nr:WD repeat-containing protein 36 [Histomonas meleagridis]KAH0799430.1 WD repeat-containing protein 36 [Histomonas meleagridis]